MLCFPCKSVFFFNKTFQKVLENYLQGKFCILPSSEFQTQFFYLFRGHKMQWHRCILRWTLILYDMTDYELCSDLILFFISLILLHSDCIIITHTLLVAWIKMSKKRFAWQFPSYIFTLSLLCLLSVIVNYIMASHLYLQVGRCFYIRKTFPLDFFSTPFVTSWILTCTAFCFYIPIIKLSLGHLAPTNILLGTSVLFGFRESIHCILPSPLWVRFLLLLG